MRRLSLGFYIYVFFSPPSAGLPSLDPSELPQPRHPVRPEAAAAGGGAGGRPARGPGGMPAGRGAEGGVREAEGGDEDAAEQPEGQGSFVLVHFRVRSLEESNVQCNIFTHANQIKVKVKLQLAVVEKPRKNYRHLHRSTILFAILPKVRPNTYNHKVTLMKQTRPELFAAF